MSLNKKELQPFLVYQNGNINQQASIAKFVQQMNLMDLYRETNKAQLAAAVACVFDKHRGKAITRSALVNFAIQDMVYDLDSYSELSEMIHEYIKSNTGAHGFSLFGLKPGMGYFRWSDYIK